MNQAEKIAKAIFESNKTCVLTGAGMSTESGIPDFRSPETGLWARFDPMLMTAEALENDPENFYKKGMEVLNEIGKVKGANPNKGHKILANMEQDGYISCLITQNVDGLHIGAGSKNVYEVHGNLRDAHCLSCGREYLFSDIESKVSGGQVPPLCDRCGGIIRPDVVLFGDMLPDYYGEAIREVRESDLLVVIGSSLEISPVNMIPAMSCKYIIINREETSSDKGAYIVWHQSAVKALGMIYKELKKIDS
jgi:NAD-dependent deacetylase